MAGLLITRPEPYNDEVRHWLEASGHTVYVAPMLKISVLDTNISGLAGYPVLLFTSRSALRALEERRGELDQKIFDRACYCVGAQTAKAASRLGFVDVREAAGAGRYLADMLLSQEAMRRPIAHICGQEVSEEPRASLRSAGWDVAPFPLYRAEPYGVFPADVAQALRSGEITVVLLYSARTAKVFAETVLSLGLGACCHGLLAVGSGKGVVDAVASLGMRGVVVHTAMDPTAILDFLNRQSGISG